MARARTEAPEGAPESAPPGAAGDGAATMPPEEQSAPEALSGGQMIHAAMIAVLAELPAIGKTSENTQQGFMFRSHDAVLNAINPLLAKHGIYVVPHVMDRVTDKRATRSGSVMYEVNLHVQYRFIAADGSWIDCSTWGEGTDSGDKATNKAMTMAFKNALAQAFAVSTQDTLDADATSPEETITPQAAQAQTAEAAAAAQALAAGVRADQMRFRIRELASDLDKQAEVEEGTWIAKVHDATQAAFGEPFEAADAASLEEVGKALKAIKDSGTTDVPDQLEFVKPS